MAGNEPASYVVRLRTFGVRYYNSLACVPDMYGFPRGVVGQAPLAEQTLRHELVYSL